MKKLAALFLLTLFFYTPAHAQCCVRDSLFVSFTSEPGTRPSSIFSDGFATGDAARLDATGNGKPDLIMEKEDNEGKLQGLIVIDGGSLSTVPDTILFMPDVQGAILDSATVFLRFAGFCDCDADGTREVVFITKNEVVLVDPRDPGSINWRSSFQIGLPPELRLVAITDMTDDGFEEIVATLPEARTVLIFADNPMTTSARR